MEFIKKIWGKLKEPKIWFLILFYTLFLGVVGGTITLLVIVKTHTVWHFILYILSAIFLIYFCYTIYYISPKITKKVVEWLKKHKFTNQLLENYGYRTLIMSSFSFILNMAYVAFMGVLALKTMSAWYIAMTAYYLILSLMKGNIYYSKRKHDTPHKKAKAYKFCGIMFIFLSVVFSGILFLIYYSDMSFEYAGLLIYVVAVFTFYKLTLAIINIIKSRQQEDYYVQGLRDINLVSALVSLVVLQVALIQAFSPENSTTFANAITGGVVCLIILTLGIYMIIKAQRKIRILEETYEN